MRSNPLEQECVRLDAARILQGLVLRSSEYSDGLVLRGNLFSATQSISPCHNARHEPADGTTHLVNEALGFGR